MSREPWAKRWTMCGVVVALLASLMLTCASSEAASGCPADSAFAGFRPFLLDCREYELVTPPFKDGATPEELASGLSTISTDGNHALAFDTGGFASTENDELSGKQHGGVYELTRTAAGWTAEAIVPPAEAAARSVFVAESSDFSRSLWELSVQKEPGEEVVATSGQFKLARREQAPGALAQLVEVGPEDAPGAQSSSFAFAGASADLNTIVFGIAGKTTHWPGDRSHQSSESLYSYTGTHNREPVLVGVRNEGPLVGAAERNENAELISECGTELGSGTSETGSTYNAVSADGLTIYFTALHGTCEAPAANEIYARIGGAKTVAVSEPAMTSQRDEECSGICREDELSENGHGPSDATFQSAAKDGRKVFFTTEQPLLNVDGDAGNDLYEAELEGGALKRVTMVSRGRTSGGPALEDPTPGEHARVVGVARISDDGTHAYFVARGALTQEVNGNGESAENGGFNLYDYDSATQDTTLVAVLMPQAEAQVLEETVTSEQETLVLEQQGTCEALPGREASEEEVEECYATLEALRQALPAEVAKAVEKRGAAAIGLTPISEKRPFETTSDGRFLIFESAIDLTGSEDTSTVPQLFEYDATTAKVVRASIGDRGYNDDGNTTNAEYVPRIVVPNYAHGGEPTAASASLSVSEVGSVYFTSRDGLTSTAVEGHENVYEYEPAGTGSCPAAEASGCLGLISPGDEVVPAEVREKPRLLGTDQSGVDVFFASSDNLLPRDIDSQIDWYDARVGGGFQETAPAGGCNQEACQGAAAAAPTLPVPGGSAVQPGEAPAPPPASVTRRRATAAARLATALKACRRGPRRKRRACEARARSRFRTRAAAKKAGGAKR
jgi:hypothetical protein